MEFYTGGGWMPDRETVLKGLKRCENHISICDECPYVGFGPRCILHLTHDALVMLKELEPVELEEPDKE